MNGLVKKINFTGIAFTIAATAGFVWAIFQLYYLWRGPLPQTIANIKLNEQSAFLNLRIISEAQKKYKEKDWDGDGKKTYAKYFIHLWTSVNTAGKPVYVGLIPKKLGFAFETARAIDGYYFVDLHDSQLPDNKGLQRLDYEKQWAVLAIPTAADGSAEVRFFMADNSGNIYVKSVKFVPLQYVENPASNGWIEIDTIQQLRDYQKKISYIPNKLM